MRRLPCALLGLSLLARLALPAWAADADGDFAARCRAAGVVKCVAFDAPASIKGATDYAANPAPFGLLDEGKVSPMIDSGTFASGGGSLKFTIPGNSGTSFGAYWTNFSDDFSVQFGVGDDFYIQWRQRFSPEFLNTTYYEDYANKVVQGGWKQVIIGEGDRPGTNIYSCTDLEIVPVNGYLHGFPQLYHSCGAKDGQYEGLQEPFGSSDFLLQNAIRDPGCLYSLKNAKSYVPPCLGYVANQWMTFQVHVHVGTPYTNDKVYKHDSIIQMWVAEEAKPAQLVVDYSPKDPACQARQQSQPACQTGYDLFNDNPSVRRYGQIWLLPYMTRKDPAQPHDTGYTWYDELIISRARIADPGVASRPPPADAGTPAPVDARVYGDAGNATPDSGAILPTGGAGADAGGGCGCRVAAARPPAGSLLAALVALLGARRVSRRVSRRIFSVFDGVG